MKMKLNKNKKGVALIWAIVVLVVSILIVTGILMMAQIYHKRENTSILKNQAEYYAKSGINIMSSQIVSGDMDSEISAITPKSPRSYVIEIDKNINVTVTIKKEVASYQLNLESTYDGTGNVAASVYGRMVKSTNGWTFQGYYVK